MSAQATSRWSEIKSIWGQNPFLFAVAGFLFGLLAFPFAEQLLMETSTFLVDLIPEAVGIVFTVAILDRFAENRAIKHLQTNLQHQAGSKALDTAVSAIDRLRSENWLTTDSPIRLLDGEDLRSANLHSAYLNQASFVGANLNGAKLQNTRMRGANLERASLQGTHLQGARLGEVNLKHANLENAIFDTSTILPDAQLLVDENGEVQRDENGKRLYNNYWTPETDMSRYTNPDHPDFWQPDWAKVNNK